MTTAMAEKNLIDPDLFPAGEGPPHALFDQWRESDPVHWNPANPGYLNTFLESSGVSGFWVLTRYKDVFAVSNNQDQFSSHEKGIVLWEFEGDALERQRGNFMLMKPAEHMAVRKMILPPFLPKSLAALAPRIEQLAAEIIDSVAARGDCEFVFDVASKLPIFSFCELMGIDPRYRQQVAEYGDALADVETRASHSLDPMIGLFAIAEELAEEKRRNPDDRLMSAMVNDPDLALSQLEINQFFLVFAIAGHETTRATAVHFIELMNRYPEQYALLRSDFDAHVDNAIDEVLRFTAPTTNFMRTAMEDTEIGGTRVRKGDRIYLSYAAANRDPLIFEDPHRFDITRPNAKRHLSFGAGPHLCVGSRLAKLQLRALLRQVVTRLPDIHPVGEPEWLRSIWFNAIIRMPVVFTPER